jgi:hypothetical protein
VDHIRSYSLSKEETSDAGYYVLIPMWEVATHDWRTCEPRLRPVQKRETVPFKYTKYLQDNDCLSVIYQFIEYSTDEENDENVSYSFEINILKDELDTKCHLIMQVWRIKGN